MRPFVCQRCGVSAMTGRRGSIPLRCPPCAAAERQERMKVYRGRFNEKARVARVPTVCSWCGSERHRFRLLDGVCAAPRRAGEPSCTEQKRRALRVLDALGNRHLTESPDGRLVFVLED